MYSAVRSHKFYKICMHEYTVEAVHDWNNFKTFWYVFKRLMRKQYGKTGVLHLEPKHDTAVRNLLSFHIKHILTRAHYMQRENSCKKLFSWTLKDVVYRKSMADQMAKTMENLGKFKPLGHIV